MPRKGGYYFYSLSINSSGFDNKDVKRPCYYCNNEYESMLRRFNNFKAYYFPEVGQNIEFETTTPVNSFRVLFNLYFDYNYDLLEDKVYSNDIDKPYQFTDVTELVIKNYTR